MSFWGDSGGFLADDDDGAYGDEEQSSTGGYVEAGRDALIFLIDVTRPMFTKQENDLGAERPFEVCVKCALNVLKSKIISRDKDLVGIVFFGTEKFKNASDFQHVYVQHELDVPDSKNILLLETLVRKESNETFHDNYGHSEKFLLSDALWACSNMFASSSYKIAQKRVLLFTSTDDPHAKSPDLRRRALKKAKDLADLGIEVDLLHMKQGFDVGQFYRDIISDDAYSQISDPSEKFDELLSRVRMKEYKKRAVTRLVFNLPSDVTFGVSAYVLNRQATKGQYVKVDSRSNEEVKSVTKYICQDTGQELLPTDIKLYKNFGGAKVIFEKEEVAQMKSMIKTGLNLLGFKPRSCLKLYHHVKPAWFLYPDESTILGSTSLFTALLRRCLAREVMPVCVLVTRLGVSPRFVALLPQKEEFDEHHVQLKPPGFHAIYLPYSDDIRKLKLQTRAKATDEQIDKAKHIVEKLTINYTPDMFENPSIQKFYRCLEAFALDRDEVEEFTDLTQPNNDAIARKAGQVISEFKELVFPSSYSETSGLKRKTVSGSSTSGSAKKFKTEEKEINVEETAKNGNLNKFTVAILRSFCQANKIKTTSQKKADLVKNIKEYFGL